MATSGGQHDSRRGCGRSDRPGDLSLWNLDRFVEEMHRRIAGSQLVIIEDASHLCFADQSEEFNRVINSFMT